MKHDDRRTFIQTLAGAALATPASPVLGANDRINIGIVGIGGRGRDHIDGFAKQPQCRIAAVCDVNQAGRERGAAQVEKLLGYKPEQVVDMRRLFEDKDIDAVSFATPNHWHALGAIWACQAGKDVYVEKPPCHNIYEGRKMVEAARKYNRIVQVGSQSRSSPLVQRAVELLGQGVIGKVYEAKGLCFNPRKSIGHTPDQPVPPGIDWNLFLGPAPMRPFSRNRYAYNWHWFWDTGNGDIGNQGIHEMDKARWGLNRGLPRHVSSTGGKFVYQDDQETPNTQLAVFDYGDAQITFDVRGLITPGEGDVRRGNHFVGNIFFGSEGFLTLDGFGFRVYRGDKRELAMEQKPEGGGPDSLHLANFLSACRSRDYRQLAADIEVGVTSVALVHFANISYRVGRRLTIDPERWSILDDAEASRMLTRDYRAPYVVPERV
ncbi:MAG: Gfo/Idh/MocA family oxidoreductase [Bryobacterales bacterium]|nr:Gfo/Idh/MocA family oxidoreductase [Bryobacterales bacterium]